MYTAIVLDEKPKPINSIKFNQGVYKQYERMFNFLIYLSEEHLNMINPILHLIYRQNDLVRPFGSFSSLLNRNIKSMSTERARGIIYAKSYYHRFVFDLLHKKPYRYTIVLISIKKKNYKKHSGHSNVLIVDWQLSRMDRYNPTQKKNNFTELDKYLYLIAMSIGIKKYYPPSETCPFLGLQKIQAQSLKTTMKTKTYKAVNHSIKKLDLLDKSLCRKLCELNAYNINLHINWKSDLNSLSENIHQSNGKNKGFCVGWTLWLIEQKIKFPHLSLQDINAISNQIIIKKLSIGVDIGYFLTNFIYNYYAWTRKQKIKKIDKNNKKLMKIFRYLAK